MRLAQPVAERFDQLESRFFAKAQRAGIIGRKVAVDAAPDLQARGDGGDRFGDGQAAVGLDDDIGAVVGDDLPLGGGGGRAGRPRDDQDGEEAEAAEQGAAPAPDSGCQNVTPGSARSPASSISK